MYFTPGGTEQVLLNSKWKWRHCIAISEVETLVLDHHEVKFIGILWAISGQLSHCNRKIPATRRAPNRLFVSPAALRCCPQLRLIDDLSIETFATLGVGVHPQRMESNGSYGAMATPTGEYSGGSDQSGSRSGWFVVLYIIIMYNILSILYHIILITITSTVFSLAPSPQATLVYFESIWSVWTRCQPRDLSHPSCSQWYSLCGSQTLRRPLWARAMLSCRSIAILLKELNHCLPFQ